MVNQYSGSDKRLQYLFQDATKVVLSNTLNEGDEIAKFTIDDEETIIKSPKYSTVTYTPALTSGSLIGLLTIDDEPYGIYSPITMEVEYEPILTDYVMVDENGRTVYSMPTFKIGALKVDDAETPIYSLPGTIVNYTSYYQTGIIVGTITVRTIGLAEEEPEEEGEEGEKKPVVIDRQDIDIIIPTSGGGSGVSDVLVNGRSVVINGVAGIDLTPYQLSLQHDIDRIYDVCVGMGHTPPSHGFADVMLTALYAMSDKKYYEVESLLNVNMRYFDSAKEVE